MGQRSKEIKIWLTQGDRNTRFFIIERKGKWETNTIFRLKDGVNQWVDSHQEISTILYDSFKSTFQSTTSLTRPINVSYLTPFVSDNDCTNLLALVSVEETKIAFFDMNPHKAQPIVGERNFRSHPKFLSS